MISANDLYIAYASLVVNMVITNFTFKNTIKRRILSIILTIVIVPFSFLWYYRIRYLHPVLHIIPGGLFFAVPFFYMVQGTLFQKFFLMNSEIFICQLVSVIINLACRTIFINNMAMESLVTSTSFTFFLLLYLILGIKYGKIFMRKLFYVKGTLNWILYTFLPTISIFINHGLYIELLRAGANSFTLYHWLPLFYMGVSFTFLCYSIITTQDKLIVQYEHRLSMNILQSGKNYYEKITNLYEEVRILRHDYKYHLAALQGMLSSPQTANEYLLRLTEESNLDNTPYYCENMAINAILHDYSKRCKKLDVEFSIKISLPSQYDVMDYELCIIIGNLMENALLATSNLEKERYIHLDITHHNHQLAIRVQNSFDGILIYDSFGEELTSKKEKGGVGIRSIRTIVCRYQGYYTHSSDKNNFTAYVLLVLTANSQLNNT